MKRKIFLISILFSLIFSLTLSAQGKKSENEKRRELEAFRKKRIEYITKEVGLTNEEAKEFWPLCDELEKKKFNLNRNMRNQFRKEREARETKKQITESEYDELINLNMETKFKELELEKEYTKKIRKILSAEKVYKYQRAERKLAREMFSGDQRR